MTCEHCAALEAEIAEARRELAIMGRAAAPETIDDNDRERELARWLSATAEADGAAGFRAGWRAVGRLATPRIREWERLWWKASRETDRLRSKLGWVLRELSRLSDSG